MSTHSRAFLLPGISPGQYQGTDSHLRYTACQIDNLQALPYNFQRHFGNDPVSISYFWMDASYNEAFKMAKKPTYQELEQRVNELEEEVRDLKFSENALKESERIFRSVFDSIPASIVLVDEEGRIIDIGP